MSMNIKPENRRLLEALDYIDDKIVEEMLVEVKVPDFAAPERNKKTTRKSIKYFLALAASLLLISAVIPLITYLVEIYPLGQGGPASQPTESDFEEYIITEDDLAEINAAWNEKFGTGNFADTPEEAMYRKKKSRFYFGRYGCSIVIIEDSGFGHIGSCTVGGNSFTFEIDQQMWVFNGSKAYTPEEAENEGILTPEHISAIYDYYLNDYTTAPWYWEFTPTLEYLTPDQMRQVSDAIVSYMAEKEARYSYQDFVEIIGEEEARELSEKTYQLFIENNKNRYFRGSKTYEFYYGVFGDCVVVASEGNLGVTWGYNIEGISISGTAFHSYAYRNGEVMDLGLAYDQGWLTLEDIARIASRHCQYGIALDAKDYLLGEPYLEPIAELEALPKELLEDRYEKLNTGFPYDDIYLGNIGYGWVFLETTDEPNETESVNIAGYEFYTGKYRKLMAYTITYDGHNNLEAHDLAELYREKSIPDVLIKIIYQRNEEYEKYFNLSPIKEIYEAAETHFGNEPVGNLQFYGTYNGYTVVALSSAYAGAFTEFEFAGYEFRYPDSITVWVCHCEEKYSLQEAYEKVYLTDADIAKIYQAYKKYMVFYK